MKLTLKIFILSSIMTTGFFVALIYYSLTNLHPVAVSKQAALGKKVWEKFACIECHTILGNGGYWGPDLSDVTKRRTIAWLRNFLQNPSVLLPAKHKKHPNLSAQDTELVIKYFQFINEIRSQDWPPKRKL